MPIDASTLTFRPLGAALGQNASCRTAAVVAALTSKPDATAHRRQPPAGTVGAVRQVHPRKQPPRPTVVASDSGPGCAKTKSDLVVMPSGGRIFAFFALRATTSLKIQGAFIPRRVFTQAGSEAASRAAKTRPGRKCVRWSFYPPGRIFNQSLYMLVRDEISGSWRRLREHIWLAGQHRCTLARTPPWHPDRDQGRRQSSSGPAPVA
jgi:hypothetical protein